MHLEQCLINGILPFEDTEKRQIGRSRAAKIVIDQIEILPQQFARFMRQPATILLCIVEDADQVIGMIPNDFRFGHSEMSFREANTFAERSPEHVSRAETGLIAVGDPMNNQG